MYKRQAIDHAVMTYDKDNRLATYNGEKVTYDERGNMLHGPLNGEMGDYTYDCRNRLIETKAADGTVTAYTYDAENTRLTEETEDVYKRQILYTGMERRSQRQLSRNTQIMERIWKMDCRNMFYTVIP